MAVLAPRYPPHEEPVTEPFWKTKKLADMTATEWESLCDGCGRCCLNKLEEEDTGKLYFTDVGCRLLEGKDLYWGHPLVSGDPDTVHAAGVSVRGRLSGTENEISDEQLEQHIVRWPIRLPKRAHEPRK